MRFILPAITTVFILAKIFGVAPVSGWSWWLVLSPMWVPLLVLFLFLFFFVLFKVVFK